MKPAQAQVAVKRTRNNHKHTPINSLPAEVLTQIFLLVSLNKENCPLRTIPRWHSNHEPRFPDFPDILAHVCSRWRQIALDCPKLWAHIDIALSCSLSTRSHDRAVAHVSRARQVPLNIHFVDPGCIDIQQSSDDEDEDSAWETWHQEMWDNNPSVFTFLTSPASRIQSLGLLLHYYYHPIHSRAIEHCLANCLPGSLTELVIHMPSWTSSFFEISTDVGNRGTTELVLSVQQLERALRSVTILSLRSKYLRWTSTAYHGLTDLRLLGGKQISVSALTGILRSSPGLRTLHCDFQLSDRPGSIASSATTVDLPEIEVLGLEAMPTDHTRRFLELINPGPKPLRLSFSDNPRSTVLQAFFARSNVQELLMAGLKVLNRARLPPEAFCLPPQLRVLVMNGWHFDTLPSTEHEETIPPAQLDAVYMVGCIYTNADFFRKAVAHLSPRRLVLWRCTIGEYGEPSSSLTAFESALGKDLCESCSIEYLTDQDPDPVQDWN